MSPKSLLHLSRAPHFVRNQVYPALLWFAGAALVWGIVAWPIPQHVFEGVVAFPTNNTRQAPREMVEGDHLQLMYHFWLAHDTWFGETEWSTNPYEFNRGSDEDEKVYNTYYFPFNVPYSVGYLLSGRAFGWNLAGIFSLWISLWTGWLWLRRMVPEGERKTCLLVAATLIGQAIPYRWNTLFNGSPTGLSLMWVPVMLLGLDMCIRDRKTWGAILAGGAIFFSGWSDTHTLFFTGLLCVFMVYPLHVHARQRWSVRVDDILCYLKRGWPLVIWAGLVLYQASIVKGGFSETEVKEGRKPEEVALFSHEWVDAISLQANGGTTETYLGFPLLIVLSIGTIFLVQAAYAKRRSTIDASFAGLMCLVILVTSLIACGTEGPFKVRGWEILVKVLPPMNMLRQPAKIYLILPALISLAIFLIALNIPDRFSRVVFPILAAIFLVDFTYRITPTICLVAEENKAYAAVADDSEGKPHAVALPLWPGDSHWSSIYQHYSTLHRIRMLNGYNPLPATDYVEEVFVPLHVMNGGLFRDRDLDRLLDDGIPHILLHENAFPEKVSLFAVGGTLRAMLTHPRLQFLAQDGPVWAFRVLPQGQQSDNPKVAEWPMLSTTIHGHSAYCAGEYETVSKPNEAVVAQLRNEEDQIHFFREAQLSLVWPTKMLAGVNNTAPLDVSDGSMTRELASSSPAWQWLRLPLGVDTTDQKIINISARTAGTAQMGSLHIVSEQWDPSLPDSVTIPAPSFFHAGHTDISQNSVEFTPRRDPHDFIFYGPVAPLDPGEFQVVLEFTSPAPSGTVLGYFQVNGLPETRTSVEVGRECRFTFRFKDTRLLRLEFKYSGAAPLSLHRTRIQRLK